MSAVAPASPALTSSAPVVSIGTRAAQGAVWTIIFSGLNKVVALASQIALAWFLLPKEMGLFATAMSVASVASIFSGGNLRSVVIQEEQKNPVILSQVFWLALVLNAMAAILVAVFGTVAGGLFREPQLAPVIFLLALVLPFMALPTVYSALLYRDLRFRTIARIQFMEGLIRNGGAAVLAACGFGAYSLILPMLGSAIFAWVSCRFAAGKLTLTPPRPRTWPALLGPAGWLIAVSLFAALQTYGASFVIGLKQNSTVTGFYYWGCSLSSQATFVLAVNLQNIFFPALSKWNYDLSLQREKFIQICRVLLLSLVPVTVLQIVLAKPAIEFLFHERWLPAIPVVQWLSFGMLTQPIAVAANALLLARGKFKILAITASAMAAAMIAAAVAGASLGDQSQIARWTGTSLFLMNIVVGWVAFRQLDQQSNSYFCAAVLPVAAAVPLGMAAWACANLIKQWPAPVCIAATAVVVMAAYVLAVKLCVPALIPELMAKLKLRTLLTGNA